MRREAWRFFGHRVRSPRDPRGRTSPVLFVALRDPPTQTEVQAIYDKVNEILDALKRV
jgi:hypothetical protein